MSEEDPNEHPTPGEAIEAGLYYFAREDYVAARRWWEYALAIDPHNARVHECLRILARTVGEDPGSGDVRPSQPPPSPPSGMEPRSLDTRSLTPEPDRRSQSPRSSDARSQPPRSAGRSQPPRAVDGLRSQAPRGADTLSSAPAPKSAEARGVLSAIDTWTRPSQAPSPSVRAGSALESWSRPSTPPSAAQPLAVTAPPPASITSGLYPALPYRAPSPAPDDDLQPDALEFDPLGFEAAWEGVVEGSTAPKRGSVSPMDRWSRPRSSVPIARGPPEAWEPGQVSPPPIPSPVPSSVDEAPIQVSATDPEWEAMVQQVASGSMTGPEGLSLMDPLSVGAALRGRAGTTPPGTPESRRPAPITDVRPSQPVDPFGPIDDVIPIDLDDESEDAVADSEPAPPRSPARPFIPVTRGAQSSQPPSVFSAPPSALPEARTFDVRSAEKSTASSPGFGEPSPEEILGEDEAPAADEGADDFDMIIEDPEESPVPSSEAPAEVEASAIDYALSAFESGTDSAPFASAHDVSTPWDYGPAETSAVILSQDMDVHAVADYTPAPILDRQPLYDGPASAPPSAQARPTPLPEPMASPPRITPSTASSGLDPAAVLERAKSRLLLHDFDGALELLESIPTNHPVYEDAKGVLAETRAHLESIYASKIGPFDAAPRVLLSGQQLIWLNLNHRAGFILSQIDGMVTYEDLVSLSGMPRLDTLRILCTLLQEGVIAS